MRTQSAPTIALSGYHDGLVDLALMHTDVPYSFRPSSCPLISIKFGHRIPNFRLRMTWTTHGHWTSLSLDGPSSFCQDFTHSRSDCYVSPSGRLCRIAGDQAFQAVRNAPYLQISKVVLKRWNCWNVEALKLNQVLSSNSFFESDPGDMDGVKCYRTYRN